MPLTDIAIRNLKPLKKTYRRSDDGGLYLEISTSGGKWWRLKYRFNGKEKRISLGVYPEVSMKVARERRDAAKKLLSDGVDPSANRKAQKSAAFTRSENSFQVVAQEWFDKFSPKWAASHSIRIIRRLERDVFPWLGERPIAEISPPELLAVLRRIENRSLETAHRALSNCSRVFRYAIATGRLPLDPSSALRGALPPMTKEHFAAITKPTRFAELLLAFDAYQGMTPIVPAALRFAPLVFVRPGELRFAEWKDFNMDEAVWQFKASKGGLDHIVPLSRQAMKILIEIQPLTGKGRFVFPGCRSSDRPMSDNALLVAMRSLGIDKQEMTAHGFRAAARTILDEVLNQRPDFIEHQLAHMVRDPNGRAYNRTAFLPERREMMQIWADYLDQLKSQLQKQ